MNFGKGFKLVFLFVIILLATFLANEIYKTQQKDHNSRIILIVLDDATPDILLPLVKKGYLPNFEKLLKEGTYGNTIAMPPDSPQMWTSIITGTKPEKHGILDFGYISDGKFVPYNITSIKTEPLWRILTERGKKVGIIDWPFSWPTESVNGFMITRTYRSMSPNQATYPKNLNISFCSVNVSSASEEEYAKTKFLEEECKEEVFFKLLDSYKVDFLAYASYITGDMQHPFFRYFHPQYFDVSKEEAEKYGNTIPETYKLIDEFIGKLISKVDLNNTILIITSDHGFHRGDIQAGPILLKNFRGPGRHIIFRMNYFLNKTGFLSFDERYEEIDFSKTKAFFCNNFTYRGICINSEMDEEKTKISKEVAKLLDELKMGEEKVFLNITTLNEAKNFNPQIIFETNPLLMKKENFLFGNRSKRIHAFDDITSIEGIVIDGNEVEEFSLENTFFRVRDLIRFNSQEGGLEGRHAATGFIIIVGKNIKRNYIIQNVRPIDIAPTILYLLGEKIPKSMDGRVLEEAVEESYLKEHSITYTTNEEYISQSKVTPTEKERIEEIEKIKKTMREVGYIQ